MKAVRGLALSTVLAARFAQEIGLRPGNYWEGPIAVAISKTYRQCGDWRVVEDLWRRRLGL